LEDLAGLCEVFLSGVDFVDVCAGVITQSSSYWRRNVTLAQAGASICLFCSVIL